MDKNNKTEIFEIKLEEIILFDSNPRYTLLHNSYELREIANVYDNDGEKHYEKNAFVKLLNSESEDGLSKLINLIESIAREFDTKIDLLPFVVYNEKFKKYIVLEGNRRLLSLKLLHGNQIYVDWLEQYEFNNKNFTEKELQKLVKEKVKILKKIINFREKKEDFFENISVNIVEWKNLSDIEYNETINKLKRTILSRHSYTESSTKKEWPRLKSLAELLNFFNTNFIIFLKNDENINDAWEKTFEYLSVLYDRKKNTLKKDLYNAVFVLKILNQNLINIEKMNPLLFNKKVSAIELSMNNVVSLERGKKLRDFLNYGNLSIKQICNSYEKLKFDLKDFNLILNYVLTNLLTINEEIKSWKEISDFLLIAWDENKWLNTRGYKPLIKNEKKIDDEAVLHISKFFNEDFNISKRNAKNMNLINLFSTDENDNEKSKKNIEDDLFKKIWKDVLRRSDEYSNKIFLNITNEEIWREYNKFKINNINIIVPNEMYTILFSKSLAELLNKINVIYLDNISNKFLKSLIKTWNFFYNNELSDLIKINKHEFTEWKKKYRILFSSFRSLIESFLIFETFFRWETANYNEKHIFEDYSFLSSSYRIKEIRDKINNGEKVEINRKEIIRNVDDNEVNLEKMIFDYNYLILKMNGLNNWIINNGKNNVKSDSPLKNSIEMRDLYDFLCKYKKSLNFYVHNYHFISDDEFEFRYDENKEEEVLIATIKQIGNIYKIINDWKSAFKTVPYFYETPKWGSLKYFISSDILKG